MSRRRLARTVLAANAAFSTCSAGLLILFPGLVADWVFVGAGGAHTTAMVLLGLGLAVFACAVGRIACDRYLTSGDLHLIAAADLTWVAGSVVVLWLAGAYLTTFGWYAITVIAVAVADFALVQVFAARKLVSSQSRFIFTTASDELEAKVVRATSADPRSVWRVMTDHPGYADVADSLSKVEVASGSGVGMQRKCYGLKGESWSETCDLYREGEIYGFNVDTEAPDYPLPFKKVQGRWSVEEVGNGSQFTITIRVRPKTALTGWLMKTIGFRNIRKLMISLAENWAQRMEAEQGQLCQKDAAE